MSKRIQLQRLTNTAAARHTTKAKLPLGDGEEEITIVYRGMSLRESIALEEKYKDEDPNTAMPKILAEQIVEIPEIYEGEEPVSLSVEFFETLDTFVLHRIASAIREDRTGNPTS